MGWQVPAVLALVAAACAGPMNTSVPGITTTFPSGRPSLAARPSPAASSPAASSPAVDPAASMPADLPPDQVAALNTVTKVDDYPLYTMRYRRSYDATTDAWLRAFARSSDASAGCSLFAALADKQHVVYGRNFDWDYSPGLMLFYTPVDGYPSVSMTPISFLDYTSRLWSGLDTAAMADRQQLLNAPALAFDGMNSKGLVAGFARVPTGRAPIDPEKATIATLYVIREMLDHAATIDEAIKVLEGYNVWSGPKQPLHWLVADRSGRAALLEFLDGKLVVTWNDEPWHMAVNFVSTDPGNDPDNAGWRYDVLSAKLEEAHGSLSRDGAMDVLASVQSNTLWSVVYEVNTGDVEIMMGMDRTKIHTFHLDMQP